MNLDAVKTALYTWFKRETGLTTIWAEQGAPRPQLPYAELKFLNPGRRVGGIDELRASGSTFKTAGLRSSSVELNIFGAEANNKMSAVLDSLDRPDVVEEFSAAEIAVTDENGPNDLTTLEDTKYTERSQMDLEIMYATERDAVGTTYIESAEVTYEEN